MARVMATAGTLEVTFHRAFDMSRDPLEALETLAELGVTRVLTSGQGRTVPEGQSLIRELVHRAGDRISIMPGGGVTEGNVLQIVQKTGVEEVHFTALARMESAMVHRNPRPKMGASEVPGEYERFATDSSVVRRVIRALGQNPP